MPLQESSADLAAVVGVAVELAVEEAEEAEDSELLVAKEATVAISRPSLQKAVAAP